MRKGFAGSIVGLAVLAWAHSASALTATLVGDAYTVSTSGSANKGKTTTLLISGPPRTVQTAYVQFDLSALPANLIGTDVTRATLTVFVNAVTESGAFDVQRVTSAWNEAGITAAGAPTLGAVEQSAVPLTLTDKNTFKAIDVTNAVRAWVDGTLPNNGLALVATAVSGLNAKLDSKESTAHSQAPRLEIDVLTGITDAQDNTAVGATALQSLTSGFRNTATGSAALFATTTGQANTAVGFVALSSNTVGGGNTAVGSEALSSNTASVNTAVGAFALQANTTGSYDTATGASALQENTTGNQNTANGASALSSNDTGTNNVAVGYNALLGNTTGSQNTASGAFALEMNTANNNVAVGYNALLSNTTGDENTAAGFQTLTSNTSGIHNTAVGVDALYSNTTGGHNIGIGENGGFALTTGSNNIDIGNFGNAGEANTIRIGDGGTQTRAFIAGIRGETTGVPNGVTVLIDSQGQLGTVSSSRRFKTDIRDMGNASSALMRLRPVTFKYKPELDPSGTKQYGLIAEEVEEVLPDLVARDKDGNIETVKYHLLSALLLNELQKQQHAQHAQADQIRELRTQNQQVVRDNADLKARLDDVQRVVQRLNSAIQSLPASAAARAGSTPDGRL